LTRVKALSCISFYQAMSEAYVTIRRAAQYGKAKRRSEWPARMLAKKRALNAPREAIETAQPGLRDRTGAGILKPFKTVSPHST
jgi:hypothetical protein